MLQNYIERWKGKIIQSTKRPAQIKQLEQANVLRFCIICLRSAFELFRYLVCKDEQIQVEIRQFHSPLAFGMNYLDNRLHRVITQPQQQQSGLSEFPSTQA